MPDNTEMTSGGLIDKRIGIPANIELNIVVNTIGMHAPMLRGDLIDALNVLIRDLPTDLITALDTRLNSDAAAMARLTALRDALETG